MRRSETAFVLTLLCVGFIAFAGGEQEGADAMTRPTELTAKAPL